MKQLEFPSSWYYERLCAVSLPEKGIFYACSHCEVFKIKLLKNIEIEILNDEPYDFIDSLKYSFGIFSMSSPILEVNQNKISYWFDSKQSYEQGYVTVNCLIFDKVSRIKFTIFSGDWFVASFSECGNFLLMAEPYNLEIYSIIQKI